MGTSSRITFPYNPFRHVPQYRHGQLETNVRALLNSHARHRGGHQPASMLTIEDFGPIITAIATQVTYGTNDHEKAATWTLMVGLIKAGEFRVTTRGLSAENFDHLYTGEPWGHVLVGFTDGRHGTVGPQSPGATSYTDGTLASAWSEIVAYERQLFGITLPFGAYNTGDANASMNTVRAMFAFRDSGFAGFADTWKRLFL